MLFQSQFMMAPTFAPPIVYRSKSVGSGTTVTKPVGVDVGDIVFLLVAQPSTPDQVTSGGGSWTGGSFGGDGSTWDRNNLWYCRVLTAADLSGSWTKPNGYAYVCVAYVGNGAKAASQVQNSGNVVGNIALSGVNPAAATRGIVSMAVTADSAPTGFTLRDQGTYGSGPSLSYSFADFTNYRGGSVTWPASGTIDRANLIEVT